MGLVVDAGRIETVNWRMFLKYNFTGRNFYLKNYCVKFDVFEVFKKKSFGGIFAPLKNVAQGG